MNTIGKRISESRKIKGLTQEELAEKSNINLRTIQRIEIGESEPRGKTLSLLCDVLQLDIQELLESGKPKKHLKYLTFFVDAVFLIILNLIIMSLLGYLTIDSGANVNSRVGAFLLSFFIHWFIVFFTREMNSIERIWKFGGGLLIYFLISMVYMGFPLTFTKGLAPCIVISLAVLYFGNPMFPNQR